ncbi:MAG TPA: ATP-binding protein, partial [Myxococcaceae bacterium]|nr:ATP-binding protein [Myxococcaceae bacterium]
MAVASVHESPAPAVVYVDEDPGQLKLFEVQFGERFRVRLASSAEVLLEQVDTNTPVAAVLADHRSARVLLQAARAVLPDAERLLVAGMAELGQARDAVERGVAKRFFLKPWVRGEMAAALEDAVRIFELRSLLRTARARLDTAERFATLGRVSAGIAHELSGPAGYIVQNAAALRRELAGVAAYVRRVARLRPAPEVLEQLREISEIAQDMEAGAEHVRQVSRGLTGQLRGDGGLDACEVGAVVAQVARLVRPELRGRAVLTTGGGPLRVCARSLELTQVLINVLVNAGDAIAAMERTDVGRVEVRWFPVGEHGRIEVVDDGPGLPPEVETPEPSLLVTTKPAGEGTGLGLPLCRELVGRMGGSFTLRSLAG